MSEVELLYEKAGVEKCNSNLKDIMPDICLKHNEDENYKCEDCEYNWYPEFTAEKQLELIKWLGKLDGKLEITCTYNKEKFILYFYFNRKTDKNPGPKYPYSNFLNEDIEILIASLINDIWQDLTEQERTEIRSILNG